jgi:hypothetical protein
MTAESRLTIMLDDGEHAGFTAAQPATGLLEHAIEELLSAYENGGDDAKPLHPFMDELARSLSDFRGARHRPAAASGQSVTTPTGGAGAGERSPAVPTREAVKDRIALYMSLKRWVIRIPSPSWVSPDDYVSVKAERAADALAGEVLALLAPPSEREEG